MSQTTLASQTYSVGHLAETLSCCENLSIVEELCYPPEAHHLGLVAVGLSYEESSAGVKGYSK